MQIENAESAPQWAWRQTGISANEKLVLLALASFQITHDGMCSPSKAELARRCCIKSTRTIDVAINQLVARGLVRRYSRHTDAGDQMTNIYHLQVEDA